MNILLAIVTALFFPGIILRVKSMLSGRKGPGIFQPWRNILVLLRKGSVFSSTTGLIFQIAPTIYLATVLCAILLVPFPGRPSLFDFEADLVMFAYLLALGKFMFILGAMDTGSSFEGMGANREAFYSMLVEPALFIIFGTMALITGQTSMEGILETYSLSGSVNIMIGAIGVYLLIQIAMIENSRMPVDDPKTHLELTMVHEVMILDHSGFDLALIHIGTALKFAMYGFLISALMIPGHWPMHYQLILFFAIQVLFAITIGCLESFRARKKMKKNPQFILTLSAIALLTFVLGLLILIKVIQ